LAITAPFDAISVRSRSSFARTSLRCHSAASRLARVTASWSAGDIALKVRSAMASHSGE
jgi:hypothetical protein